MIFGVLMGITLGAIPGLTGGIGMVLILPLTYYMDPLSSMVLLLSIYTGGIWGGACTAILINLPGAPASVATTFDGYPMAIQGKGSYALGLSIGASVTGGLLGIFALWIFIEPLARFAVTFGPAELFVIMCMGVAAIASLSYGSFWKGLFSGAIGLMTGTIGFSTSEVLRGTFGFLQLYDGIPNIPPLIGLFAISEMLLLTESGKNTLADMKTILTGRSFSQILIGIKRVLVYPFIILRSSLIGLILGLIPGCGATTGSILAYDQAKRWSKNPEKFGHGAEEGIVAAEAGNNSTEGGSLATALALGIPGSAGTAILLAAMGLQGIETGPRLLIDNRDLIYTVIGAEFIELLLLGILGIGFAYLFSSVLYVPIKLLIPVIITLGAVGAFALDNLMFNPQLVFIFGVLGWLMRKTGFPITPMVVGIILGPLVDYSYTLLIIGYPQGLLAIFSRPVSVTLFVLFMLISIIPHWKELMVIFNRTKRITRSF